MILGVIPAAGAGSRWGGYYKELLPIAENNWLLRRAVQTLLLGGADRVCVVSNENKIVAHLNHVSSEKVFYVIQRKEKDIFGAMAATFPHAGDLNLFAMPDTVFDVDAFVRDYKYDFYLGLHETQTPERFGVLMDNMVVNKQEMEGPQWAWGVLAWSKAVAEYWEQEFDYIESYTHAINLAMAKFRWNAFRLKEYFDMASWEDYREFCARNDR